MSSPLLLYGVPFSQPVRAVMWLLLYKDTPFEMVLINPGWKGDNGSRNPAYLAKNPGGYHSDDRGSGFRIRARRGTRHSRLSLQQARLG